MNEGGGGLRVPKSEWHNFWRLLILSVIRMPSEKTPLTFSRGALQVCITKPAPTIQSISTVIFRVIWGELGDPKLISILPSPSEHFHGHFEFSRQLSQEKLINFGSPKLKIRNYISGGSISEILCWHEFGAGLYGRSKRCVAVRTC